MECVKETWVPRGHFSENIKVTMIKDRDTEAPKNRREKELGTLGSLEEARRGGRPADQDFCLEKERQEGDTSLWRSRFNIYLSILGPGRDQGLFPRTRLHLAHYTGRL